MRSLMELKQELQDIYGPIKEDMKAVNTILQAALSYPHSEAIDKLGQHLLESPGKRLRPALTLLNAHAVAPKPLEGELLKNIHRVAAAAELIHIASLVHDDIMDDSKVRRGKPTLNAIHGGDTPIAFGDYIFAQASRLVSAVDNSKLMKSMSKGFKEMCEGQLLQSIQRNKFSLTKEDYYSIIQKKTAALLGASCEAGALLVEEESSKVALEFGREFGLAFQIIDDYLDYFGSEEALGKPTGQDFVTGEFTLPLYDFLQSLNDSARKEVDPLLENPSSENFTVIKEMMKSSPAKEQTRQMALSHIEQAKKQLSKLPDSDFKKSLKSLVNSTLLRIS